MDYKNYQTVQVIKKSDKAEIIFAAVDGLEAPVIVKNLYSTNAEIYRAIARLQSPHIPRIYYLEEHTEYLCIIEEYIDGRTLDVYLKEEELTNVQKLELMLQLCEAVEVLHNCTPPIIHRDIKPSNILITEDGIVKIIDFDASRRYNAEKNTSDTRLLGTIEYAAPEQFGYTQTDERSDIYSLGVVFSEIKTENDSSFLKDRKHLIDVCTSFDPSNRYRTIPLLKKDLTRCIRKAKRASGICARLANAARTFLHLQRPAPSEDEGPQKYIHGYETGIISYNPTDLAIVDARTVNYQINANNSVSIHYNKINSELILELPDQIDLQHCVDMIVTLKNEIGTVAIKLYDESYNEISPHYCGKLQGVIEQSFTLPNKAKIDKIGIMADDNMILDYSGFDIVLYSIRFQFIVEKTTPITYRFDELVPVQFYNIEYSYGQIGSIDMSFSEIFGQLKLDLPQPVDLSLCAAIVVKLRSRVGELAIVFYDADYNEIDTLWGIRTNAVQDRLFVTDAVGQVAAIGIMATDMNLEDYSLFHAALFSISFHMKNA